MPKAITEGDDIYDILEEIKEEMKRIRVRILILMGTAWIFYVFFGNIINVSGTDYLLALSIPGLLAALVAMPSRRLKEVVRRLASCQDTRAAGPLIDYNFHLLPPSIHRALQQSLKKLLPRLQRADAAHLNSRHFRYLHQFLKEPLLLQSSSRKPFINYPARDAFVNPVLRALAQIGNNQSLRLMQALLKGKPLTEADRKTLMLAQACISCLEAHLAQERQEQTLLRASAVPDNSPANLLRPAGNGEANNICLLHPVTQADIDESESTE